MRAVVLFTLILIVISIVPATVSATPPPATPIYPGMGDGVSDLYGRHSYIKNNSLIMGYIGECGIGRWYEKRMDNGLRAVHIPPEYACGKQLIFSTTLAGEREDPSQIQAIWILNASETWLESMKPIYSIDEKNPTRQLPDDAANIPPLFVAAGIIAVVICITFVLVERRNRSS